MISLKFRLFQQKRRQTSSAQKRSVGKAAPRETSLADIENQPIDVSFLREGLEETPSGGIGTIKGRKYRYIRTMGNSKLYYNAQGEIVGTEEVKKSPTATAASPGKTATDTTAAGGKLSSSSSFTKEQKICVNNVRIKILTF